MRADPADSEQYGLEGGPDVIVRANARGVILFVSATCRSFGYEAQYLVGKLAIDFVHPADRERLIANTASLYRPGALSISNARVHRFRHKDGSWAWLRGNPKVLPSPDGQRGEVLNFFEPISEEAATKCLAGSHS